MKSLSNKSSEYKPFDNLNSAFALKTLDFEKYNHEVGLKTERLITRSPSPAHIYKLTPTNSKRNLFSSHNFKKLKKPLVNKNKIDLSGVPCLSLRQTNNTGSLSEFSQ
mmetsp:Transcript_23745/g.26368  ORF Transcript_23745/g.26368 Transcript_23745/m.26368 type:complete len:108 (+) Transcript_23745:39-362(+)